MKDYKNFDIISDVCFLEKCTELIDDADRCSDILHEVKYNKYVCSELAVKRVMQKYAIDHPYMVQFLKICESLEQMPICTSFMKKKLGKSNDINCDIYTGIDTEYLNKNASEHNPISVRVNQRYNPYMNWWQRPSRNILHTINIIGFEEDTVIYHEEDNNIYNLPVKTFEKWRYGDYAFMCQKL